MNNKKTVLLIVICLTLLMVLTVAINVISNVSWKEYNVGAVQEQCIRYYEEKGIRLMDFIDMTNMFGISLDEASDATFLSNIDTFEDPTLDSMMIIVINTDSPEYYYDIFRSYLDSYILNLEDLDVVNMYKDAVLEKGDNYVYFISGQEAKLIENEISLHYQ